MVWQYVLMARNGMMICPALCKAVLISQPSMPLLPPANKLFILVSSYGRYQPWPVSEDLLRFLFLMFCWLCYQALPALGIAGLGIGHQDIARGTETHQPYIAMATSRQEDILRGTGKHGDIFGHCYYQLSVISRSSLFYVFCFWPTSGKLPRLNICVPQYFSITRNFCFVVILFFLQKKVIFVHFFFFSRPAFGHGRMGHP